MKTPFWVIFLRDPMNGVITGTAYGHNATADYKTNRYYIGTEKIEVDLQRFKPTPSRLKQNRLLANKINHPQRKK